MAQLAGTLLTVLGAISVHANSVGLTSDNDSDGGNVVITVEYDFSDFAMFGGGMNLVYDPTVWELVSYTQAPLSPDAQGPASPVGQFEQPGLYTGFGIGTFEFFNGMTSAGEIGSFILINLSSDPDPSFLGCGGDPTDFALATICITPNATNPFVSLAGEIVDEDIFVGPGAYIPPPEPIPVPAAVWLFASAIGLVLRIRKPSCD